MRNKKAQELLDKAIKLERGDKIPLFTGIYIMQERRLHDSGYRLMNVIGHTEYDKELTDYKSRCEKAIPMLKKLNIKLKNILKTGIDIKEISDIEDTLNGRSDE